MGIALCMEIAPQNSGGQHGCEKSSTNWQQRHKRMAKFWDRLDRPPEKAGGPDLQDRQGQSRRQWVHGRRMGKVAELGEEMDMDLIQVHNAICDHVHVRERPRVSGAVSQLMLGVCDAAGDCAAETIPVVVGCLTDLAEKGIDPEDEESYYSDEEDLGEVDPVVAAKGLGQVGDVTILDTLWSRCVPEDLRSRYCKWRDVSRGVGSSDGVGVRDMLDALVQDGALSRRTSVRQANGKAQARPKSSEKCAFILNCVKQNACDSRKPRGFQLPQIEHLRHSVLLGGQQKLYMAKVDLSNCFWPMRLPTCLVGEFSVCGRGPVCVAVLAFWLEVFTPPMPKIGVQQCSENFGRVVTCAIFCLPV